MTKIVLNSDEYVFSPSEGTLTVLNNINMFTKERLLLITNTTRNEIIYNFGCDGYGGDINGATITLEYNVKEMSINDSIQVLMYTDTTKDTALLIEKLVSINANQSFLLSNVVEQLMINNELLKSILS